MTNNVFVSIIIPLFNKEHHIDQTIQSVLDQTYHNFEIIIVNDGSTDNSVSQVETFDDPRIRIIHQKNQGVSVARNAGIRHAKANWIAFLDADDYWENTFLEKLVALTIKFPEGKIFSSGRKRKFSTGMDEYKCPYLPPLSKADGIDYIKIISKSFPPIHSSSCLICKDLLLESKGFIPGMKQYEDHELWIRLCSSRPLYFLNEPLLTYRKNDQNNDSASTENLLFKDFIVYLNTLIDVRHRIKESSRIVNLQQYAFTFFAYCYATNCTFYTIAERKKLLKTVKMLLTVNKYNLLKMLVLVNPVLTNFGLKVKRRFVKKIL